MPGTISRKKGVQSVIYRGPGGSNFRVVSGGTDPVREQDQHPVGVWIAPKASSSEPQVAETAHTRQASSRGLVGRFSVEPGPQRSPRAFFEQGCEADRLEPSGASSPGVEQRCPKSRDALGGSAQPGMSGQPVAGERPGIFV